MIACDVSPVAMFIPVFFKMKKLEDFLSFWEVMLGAGSQAFTDRKEQSH